MRISRQAPASFRNDYVLRPEYYDLDPVFCMVSNELTDPMELVINPHNRNAMLLQRAEKYKKEGLYKVVDGTIGCTAMTYIIKHLLKHE